MGTDSVVLRPGIVPLVLPASMTFPPSFHIDKIEAVFPPYTIIPLRGGIVKEKKRAGKSPLLVLLLESGPARTARLYERRSLSAGGPARTADKGSQLPLSIPPAHLPRPSHLSRGLSR